MIRLGKFDKQGYKDSFSKGELARELVCMNNDYDKLEKENQKYKEVIEKVKDYINGAYEMATYTKTVGLEEENIEDLLDILKEVEHE